MSVEAIIRKLVAMQLALPNVRAAHEFAPESVAALPCFINYPVSGEFRLNTFGNCGTNDTHVIGCDYLVSRGNLVGAEKMARPMIEAFKSAIIGDPSLGLAGVNALAQPISYAYSVEKFGSQDVLIVGFLLTVEVF